MPESSSLIGQFTGSRHYFYVTDGSWFSNFHNYFSNKKRKLLVIVKLMTNHDHFFSQYFLSARVLFDSFKVSKVHKCEKLWLPKLAWVHYLSILLIHDVCLAGTHNLEQISGFQFTINNLWSWRLFISASVKATWCLNSFAWMIPCNSLNSGAFNSLI